MAAYLDICKKPLLEEVMDNLNDDLLKLSMAEAIRCAFKFPESYVSNALNICAASYFSRTRLRTSTPDILELPYGDDTKVKMDGRVPIPAVLDYRDDYMAIGYMHIQMREVIKGVKEGFPPDSSQHWYKIYLCCFVLLSSLETVHARQVDILERYLGEVCGHRCFQLLPSLILNPSSCALFLVLTVQRQGTRCQACDQSEAQ